MIVIYCLLFGWILSLFNFHHLIIDGTAEWFNLSLSMSGYYFLWVMVGLIFSIIKAIKD
ncbi:hypothetical protein [Longirhabdus pacifica]|uniref:hypothetical protein n=1 Tax=Longirhabdus pacifica TaxID=2305227 RepID=UPI0013E8EF7F|nr:hypothetical protein [Longirhabdus pacifica]